ncbi:antirestriction protein ArdA [Amorphus orientalis]|uniref:Antirestriction protein n=1 Tax=Amorphus orientalis TaxID=649198 RepID=A0AAE3VMW4_9HYPH|nr:antirestriction protein ArdA [Amorphus orientalis]MDQ0314601.1 antirestriction protein [Amorphus orientalis]
MTLLFAQPYDVSASGFFFETIDQYEERAAKAVNSFGERVEEFEIQFIDGEGIDAAFAKAVGLNQANIGTFLDLVDEWDEDDKRRFIVAVGECGYSFDLEGDAICDLDVDLYEGMSLRELAEEFVDEGLFGEIPENLRFYIDYDAIARDLAMDYVETEIAGTRLVYRCA